MVEWANGALALGDGRFRSVTVTPGRVGEARIEILDGLEPDQMVVTSAQFLLDSESNRAADLQRLEAPAEAGDPDQDGHHDMSQTGHQHD